MKLLNKSLIYLSVSLFVIIGLWSVIFYFNIRREIEESVDEGLENYKRQIIYKVQHDSTLLLKSNFEEGFFAIREIPQSKAVHITDSYINTTMLMQDADDQAPEIEPIRLFTTAFENNGKYYELKIINSMVEEDDLVEELLRESLGLYLFLIIAIIIINNVVLKRLWQPFYALLNQLETYRIGKNIPEIKTNTKEFQDLQKAVNILLDHNIETYEQQKQFIGNASHELQTPLAIVINKLELLIENGNLFPEQAENIAESMQIIERLVRLNKSLLLLTKIENKQFLENNTITINTIVKQNLSDLEDLAAYKGINLSVKELSKLVIEMDQSLANIVISNLLRNAIFHNIENGKINIEIHNNTLKISNTGLNSPIDKNKLFSRFHKTQNKTNGTGLGLAIVKAICNLYGFSISYSFENNLHSFEIRLK